MKKKRAATKDRDQNTYIRYIVKLHILKFIDVMLRIMQYAVLLVKKHTKSRQVSLHFILFLCDTTLNGLRIKKKIQQASNQQNANKLILNYGRMILRYSMKNLCIEVREKTVKVQYSAVRFVSFVTLRSSLESRT